MPEERILIVEDQATGVEIQSRLGESLPFQIEGASSLSQCLAHRLEDYALVLVGENLIDASGIEAVEKITAVSATPVVLSGNSTAVEQAEEARRRGASDYIPRTPGFLDRLPMIIRQKIEKARERRDHIASEWGPPSAKPMERVSAIPAIGPWTPVLAGLAHQLNNPLTSIIGYTQLLTDGELNEEERRAYLTCIERASARCKKILDGLASFTQPRALRFQPTFLSELIEEAVAAHRQQLEPLDIEVRLKLEPELPLFPLDRDQICKVISMLLDNALDALVDRRHGKQIRIVLESAETPDGDGAICIRVIDNGEGIPSHNVRRVMEPFFSTRANDKGVGLGLNVASTLVEAHGGSLVLDSKPGKMTSATVFLPWNPHEPSTEASSVQRPSVLVVDDEGQIRELVDAVLDSSGYRVLVASNVEDALEQLQRERPNLILTDLKMPGLGGKDLFERAAGSEATFVFMTGDTMSPESSRFLSKGYGLTLAKPFSREELLAAVRSAIA